MKTSLTDAIEKLELLSAADNGNFAAMTALLKGSGLLLDLNELKKASDMSASSEARRELKQYLKSLPDECLYALVALMFASEGQAGDLLVHWKASKLRVPNRDEAVRVLADRDTRMKHIRDAVASRPVGTHVDDLPRLLSHS